MNSLGTLEILPREIIDIILDLLSVEELCSLRLVSKKMKNVLFTLSRIHSRNYHSNLKFLDLFDRGTVPEGLWRTSDLSRIWFHNLLDQLKYRKNGQLIERIEVSQNFLITGSIIWSWVGGLEEIASDIKHLGLREIYLVDADSVAYYHVNNSDIPILTTIWMKLGCRKYQGTTPKHLHLFISERSFYEMSILTPSESAIIYSDRFLPKIEMIKAPLPFRRWVDMNVPNVGFVGVPRDLIFPERSIVIQERLISMLLLHFRGRGIEPLLK